MFCWFTFQSTALVMRDGQFWTSPNHTFFLGKLPVIWAHTFACNWQQPFFNKSAEGRRMTLKINSWSILRQYGIKHVTPGSAVRCQSVFRNVTNCAFLWHDDGKMEFNTTKLYSIYWLIFLTLIELLHETPVFSCINHKQITLLQKCINHYHKCEKCRIKVLVAPNPNIVVGTWRNRLNETFLLSTQNKYLNWWAWASLQF